MPDSTTSVTLSDPTHHGADEMEAQVNEDRIFTKLDAIEEKSDKALIEIGKLQEQVKNIPDHENRLRALEQWRWGLVGVSGLLVTAFTTYASKGSV